MRRVTNAKCCLVTRAGGLKSKVGFNNESLQDLQEVTRNKWVQRCFVAMETVRHEIWNFWRLSVNELA